MKSWTSTDEILDFAIAREEEAVEFYERMAARAEDPAMRRTFAQFAAEERGHREKLVGVKEGRLLLGAEARVVADLKIGDYLVAPQVEGELDYPKALILAMKREKAAFRLYSDLAERAGGGPLAQLFGALAAEEARHKLRFEVEYDDEVLVEN